MSTASTPLFVPSWYYRLPIAPGGKRALIVDHHVLRGYLLLDAADPALQFVFESGRVQIQIGRQVIDEAVNDPDVAPDRRRIVDEALADLQRRGVLLVTGASQLSPSARRSYNELAVLLRAHLSAAGALVMADAIVKRIPLLALERRAGAIVRNDLVQRFLMSHGLPTDPAHILIE